MSKWTTVVGLEVHAEMLTDSKMFSPCPVVDSVTAPPNQAVDELSLGMPGTLPVVNMKAMEYGMMVGLALNCEIPPFSQFARKSYFYPDLPKGYQISQYEHPLAVNGHLDIELADGTTKRINIRRAHMEEDTGKLTHWGDGSLVDYNRAGVPLLEIVTEPDFRSSEETEAYARKLRAILQYLGVNHGDMSKGILRFEANVSVMHEDDTEFRQRTEIKNLNSIRSMVRAIDYEVKRQIKIWESGDEVKSATLGWDENAQKIIDSALQGTRRRVPLLPGPRPTSRDLYPGGGRGGPCQTAGATRCQTDALHR
jgi:aspartyl-tRNA(Asn)/glutamyl-tRNA(Gln) amidotransferase subunit B